MQEHGGHTFTQLQPVTVSNGDTVPLKRSGQYCGTKGKFLVAATLFILILVIFSAAIVMVAIAHAGKESTDTNSTSSVPVAERVKCPLKTQDSCTKGGCLYSDTGDNNQELPPGTPKCFYPKDYYTLSDPYTLAQSDALKTQVNLSIVETANDSLVFTIGTQFVSKRKKRDATTPIYTVNKTEDGSFFVGRKNNEEIVFDFTGKSSLNPMKKFMSITFSVPEYSKVYGIGRFSELVKDFDDTIYTIWSRSEEEGAHPFILLQSNKGFSSGVFIDTTYPMDIQLLKGYKINIVVLTTTLKVRLFMGPTSADVIRQYWDVIKKPTRPPYWGLGHFYGSKSVSSYTELVDMVRNSSQLDTSLPVEGYLLSAKLNQDNQPFTLDQQTLDYIAAAYKKIGVSFVLRVPPTVTMSSESSKTTWPMYTGGLDQKVFLAQNTYSPAVGMLDNKMVLYPDFTATNVTSWWEKNITAFSKGYGFHFRRNTPYNDISGNIGVCEDLDTDINLAKDVLNLDNLEANTLCLSTQGKKCHQLAQHNLYSIQQAEVTLTTLTPWSVSKRPFIVSDSTSPGIGQYAGHFHDSNQASYQGLRSAINELVTYNFLGVPLTGPNLCTHESNSLELCKRWYYLSVVTPIAWSYATGVPHIYTASLAASIIRTLKFRQSLLPYHYNAQYQAGLHSKVPVRFMGFDYPSDEKAALYEDQLLLGEAILYTPVLRPEEVYRVSYLPTGVWCNWLDGACHKGPVEVQVLDKDGPESFTFLKGGTAIVSQISGKTVALARKQKVRLMVVLDGNGAANSTQFFDDGETSNTIPSRYYSLVNYHVANETLTVKHLHNGYLGGSMKVKYEKIYIYGLTRKVVRLKKGNSNVRFSCLSAGDTAYYKLVVSDTNVNIGLNEEFAISWEF